MSVLVVLVKVLKSGSDISSLSSRFLASTINHAGVISMATGC